MTTGHKCTYDCRDGTVAAAMRDEITGLKAKLYEETSNIARLEMAYVDLSLERDAAVTALATHDSHERDELLTAVEELFAAEAEPVPLGCSSISAVRYVQAKKALVAAVNKARGNI